MIQSWIRDKLADELPGLEWTVDYESAEERGATVFYEGGGTPGSHDIRSRYPRYMVWIASVDFEEVEAVAQQVFDILHRIRDVVILVPFYRKGRPNYAKPLLLQSLKAATEPNRVGVDNEKMIYSVNFDAVLIDLEEPPKEPKEENDL